MHGLGNRSPFGTITQTQTQAHGLETMGIVLMLKGTVMELDCSIAGAPLCPRRMESDVDLVFLFTVL